MPYESGMDPIGDARQPFDVKFYLVAILFLVFDVELLFLYPWAVAAYSDAIGKIATDGIRATLAAILVTESEHASVALGELGRPQTPAAFVTGPPPQVNTP